MAGSLRLPPGEVPCTRPSLKADSYARLRDSADASGHADRATGADFTRYASVTSPPGLPTAHRARRH